MESFQWNKNYITGLPEVDQQHRQLVDIINQFGNALSENTLVFDNIEALFTELAEYAQYHFQEEEMFMSQIGIDQRHLNAHIELHKIF